MRHWTWLAVLLVGSCPAFAKQVVCAGTGAASHLSNAPRDLVPNKFTSLDLLVNNLSFTVAWHPATAARKERLSIVSVNATDGSMIFATGSAQETLVMMVADKKGNRLQITCAPVSDVEQEH